jgi:site-specific recombinase XerD
MTQPTNSLQTLVDQFTRSLAGAKSRLTILAYESDLRQFFTWLQQTDFTVTSIERIKRGHIEDYLISLSEKGQTGTTRARKLISLQVFFAYLVETGIIPHSPATHMKRPKREQKSKHFLRPDEYNHLLAEAAGVPRDYCIFQVFLQTGIRVSELIALTLADVDLTQKTIIIHGKGSKERVIPLEKKALQALHLYLQYWPTGADQRVFLNYKNEGLSIRGVRKLVDKYLKRAGITKQISCHGLRRTCLTTKAARNMNAFAIQKLAGHSRMETTRIYVQLGTEDLRTPYRILCNGT